MALESAVCRQRLDALQIQTIKHVMHSETDSNRLQSIAKCAHVSQGLQLHPACVTRLPPAEGCMLHVSTLLSRVQTTSEVKVCTAHCARDWLLINQGIRPLLTRYPLARHCTCCKLIHTSLFTNC